MPEPMKYVTPDQMRDVVEKITTLGLGGGGGGTELVHQSDTGSWPAARPTAVSVIAAGISTRPNDPPRLAHRRRHLPRPVGPGDQYRWNRNHHHHHRPAESLRRTLKGDQS